MNHLKFTVWIRFHKESSSHVGRDSLVGTATWYGLDGSEVEYWWGDEIYRACPNRSWGPPSLLCNGYRVSFPGVKRPGRGVDLPRPYSAEVKERVELYICYASGPSRNLPNFTFTFYPIHITVVSAKQLLWKFCCLPLVTIKYQWKANRKYAIIVGKKNIWDMKLFRFNSRLIILCDMTPWELETPRCAWYCSLFELYVQ